MGRRVGRVIRAVIRGSRCMAATLKGWVLTTAMEIYDQDGGRSIPH